MTTAPGVPGATPSAYETWVVRMRAWSDDPRIPLDDLPPLRSDHYTPDTFARLFKHVTAAITAADRRWHEALVQAWSTSPDSFQLGQRLVQLRSTLARRVQLAGHPSLPEEAREILLKNAREDVQRYQRELEEAVVSSSSAASRLDAPEVERMLELVRTNSFLRVFDFELRQDGATIEAAPLPTVDHVPDPDTRRPWGGRRVVPRPRGE